MAFRMELRGGPEVKKELRRRRDKLKRDAKKVIKPAADLVTKAAKRTTAFVDSSSRVKGKWFGKAVKREMSLRKAIRTELVKAKKSWVKYKSGPDPKKAPHGGLVEKGHALVRVDRDGTKKRIGYVKPHPFMRPAHEETKAQGERLIAQGLKEVLEL